jgi:Zn-dependent protease with chaperone function
VTLGGLIGFVVVSVLLLSALSLIATAGVAIAGARLGRAGPAAERSAAAWALLAPGALTVTVVVALAIRGSGAIDHCIGHDHHAHLCFVHGGAWLARPWAVALAAAAVLTLLLRLSGVAWRRIQGGLAIAEVRRVAERGDRVRIARSPRVFCFVAGYRHPEVFVSSRAWEALSADEREAVIAHERAHAAQGDPWLGALIDVASVFAAPLAGGWLRARWSDAGERLCDARAAQQTAPETVADALVRLCRAGHVQHVPGGFTPHSEALEHRVRAVLAGGPVGRRLPPVAWCLAAVAFIATAMFATHLHHALETLLG